MKNQLRVIKKNAKRILTFMFTLCFMLPAMPFTAISASPNPRLISIYADLSQVKTKYTDGEILDLTGLKVLAVYSDESEKDITDKVTINLPEDPEDKIMRCSLEDDGERITPIKICYAPYGYESYFFLSTFPSTKPVIDITDVTPGNGQVSLNFDIKSANGKGYTVYIYETGVKNAFVKYNNVNYNSKGVNIKGLANNKVYYAYIEYDAGGSISASKTVCFIPNK